MKELTMNVEDRQALANLGMSLRTGEISLEAIKAATKLTLLLTRSSTKDDEKFFDMVVEAIANYHGLLSLREATIATMAETIEELDN